MSSLMLDSTFSQRASMRSEKLLWMVGPGLAITAHLLVLLYLLWTPARPEVIFQSPAAAPVVITMALMPTTSQRSSTESVAQQASASPETAPPPSPAKLDAAEKEVKNAEVKAVVHDARPIAKSEPKPKTQPHAARPRDVKPPLKKVEIKKPAEVTTPEARRSNGSEQLASKNSAPQVGAVSNQAAVMQQNWQSVILAQLQREKRYPGYALRMKQQDTVMVRFTIDRSGNVLDTAIVKSKGYAALDRESLQLLERSSPLPKPPASAFANSDQIELVVPVSFYIRNS